MNNLAVDNTLTKSQTKQPLGKVLIEAGLISATQIEIALQEQQDSNLRIGEILSSHNWIKQQTVDFFAEEWSQLTKQTQKRPLVFYFRKAGLLDESQIGNIVNEQKQKNKKVRFHNVAVQLGYVKRITVDFFLAHIFNIYNSDVFSFAKPYEILRDYNQGKQDFRRTELSKAPLMGVSLKNVQFDGSNFIEANLSSCNFSKSSLIQANFSHAELIKAILTDANLQRASFKQANLKEAHLKRANFEGANLQGADLREAYLFHTSFANADLRRAKLESEYPYEVYYNSQTRFDDNFNPQQAGWREI